MNLNKIIIAIDGYSSTGKSSFAKMIAKKYSLLYLDSGALYRCITLYAIQNKLFNPDNTIDFPSLIQKLPLTNISFKNVDGRSMTFMDNICVEDQIRSIDVASYVSLVAQNMDVRNFVNDKLREFGQNGGVVMDGRDIGTTVFPNADIKIFMVADANVRAQRRFDELQRNGQNPNFEEVLNNIKSRDYIDSHREISPLVQAKDAVVLDNTNLSVDQQLDWLDMVVKTKFGDK